MLFVISAPAATPIQHATSPTQPSRSAAGNSFNPIFSADGRYLVFLSHANNLVTNDDLGLSLDVFVRDLTNQTTTLVSINTNGIGGGSLDANFPTISSNGQWIAFASAAANLVPNDTNERSDVFVRDMANGVTRLVSVDTTGATGANGNSSAPRISADGRWVIFESTATNLVAGQFTTNLLQIYARDLQSNVTYLVSVNEAGTGPADGLVESASISADGRWVAFVSTATNLVAGVTNQLGEIFVRDIQAGVTAWASSNAAASFVESTNGYQCFKPVLSQNGDQLAFIATSPGSVYHLVFWSDRPLGQTVCVATNAYSTAWPEVWPELSADGDVLAYPGSFIWDLRQGVTIRVPSAGGAPFFLTPTLSANGRVLVFFSILSNLRVYAFDVGLNTNRLVIVNLAGEPSANQTLSFLPAVSPDGRLVAFECLDDNLVTGDQNRASDIFIRNLETGETELISVRHDARPGRTGTGNTFVNPRCISGDGRYALISSSDNALGDGDTNQVSDLYLLDLVAGTNLWVYVPTNSICPVPHGMIFPALSENGQALAFLRNSIEGLYTSPKEGYVFDGQSGALNLFNLNPTGGVAESAFLMNSSYERQEYSLSLSPDGQTLAFSAYGPDLVFGTGTGNKNIYLHNMTTRSNILVTRSKNPTYPGGGYAGDSWQPRFSPDGSWLAFVSKANNLISNSPSTSTHKVYAWNVHEDKMRLVNLFSSNMCFSPDSRYLVLGTYFNSNSVLLHDLLASNPTDVLVATNARFAAASYDAEIVTFQSLPTNRITHVLAKHIPSGTMELISVATDGVTPGNGPSEPPQITADGRYVLFASRASNLVPNDTNGCSDVFLRDRQLGLTYLLSANPSTGRSGNRPSTSPLLSSDGSTIIFASMANDLAEADYNDKQDIFVVKLARGDSDADGLDDAWEMAYFGNLAQDGSGDGDGDSLKDREEFRAGTDPTNQGSVLRALAVAPVGGQSTALMWPAALGREYQIQFKRSVTDTNWTILPTTVTVTGNTASAVDTQAGLDAARFYRILILP